MENATTKARTTGRNLNTSRMEDNSTPSSPESMSQHKRSVSGGLLAKLSFLNRGAVEESPTSHTTSPKNTVQHAEIAEASRVGALADTMRAHKGRPRKGSLRKTAILGTGGKVKLQGRDRKSSLKQKSFPADLPPPAISLSPEREPSPPARRFSYFSPSHNSSTESGFDVATAPAVAGFEGAANPPTTAYTSTTDDDADSLTFSRPSTIASSSQTPSYLPPLTSTSLQRRRSATKSHPPSYSSPLSRPPIAAEDEWDYSETEWWGWVILVVTWVVFVSGMGSCLGVWSWAWDVGETPYAPPELEDDPTLPIVGYYPALIILTAVMAWVWVVVAWVGMKYFRHAKVVGEDGGG